MFDREHIRARTGGAIVASMLALCGVFLFAACGGGDDGDGQDGNGQPAATQPAADEPTSAPTDDAAPTSAAPEEAELDVCGLVTKAEVEAALGGPVLDGEPQQAANLFTCSFNDPEAPIFTVAGIGVFVAENGDDAREVYELAKSNAAEVEEVDGVGEAAYWDATLNTMQILYGTYEVSVDVAADDGLDQVAAARAIAVQALSRLP